MVEWLATWTTDPGVVLENIFEMYPPTQVIENVSASLNMAEKI